MKAPCYLERVYELLGEVLGADVALGIMNEELAAVDGPPLNNDKLRRIAAGLIRRGGYTATVGEAFARTIDK